MDFFAGSGSTAHAVLADTDHPVRFICIQLPEALKSERAEDRAAMALGCKTIADISKARIRRVCAQEKQAGRQLGFRSFALASSNVEPWDAEAAAADLQQTFDAAIDRVKPEHAVLTHLGLDADYRKLKEICPERVEPGYDGMQFMLSF